MPLVSRIIKRPLGGQLLLNEQKGNLSIQLYVKQDNNDEEHQIDQLIELTRNNQKELNLNIDNLFKNLKTLGIE